MAVKASFTITLARVDDGAQGIAGKAGADGKTPYFHTAWADSANGATGFVTSYPTSGTKAYMGTYSDFTSADSTSYKSYTWARVLGNTGATGPAGAVGKTGATGPQGQKGDTGATGTPGKPGADGKTPYVHYAYADSADGKTNFTVTYPTTGSRAYVGILTDYTSADSTDYTKYTWAKFVGPQGNTGANGIAGKDGVGIKSTAVTYQASTSGTTAPTGTWVASPTATAGQYQWTRTVWTYTDGTTETGYSVGHIGANGANGKDGVAGKPGVGIKSTTITYATSTSGTTAPTGGWVSTPPATAPGQFMWTRTTWSYTDGTNETGYSVAKAGETGPAGKDGKDGVPGEKGADGKTSYVHTAWAWSPDGSDRFMTEYPNENLFIGSELKTMGKFNQYLPGGSTSKLENGVYTVTIGTEAGQAGLQIQGLGSDLGMEKGKTYPISIVCKGTGKMRITYRTMNTNGTWSGWTGATSADAVLGDDWKTVQGLIKTPTTDFTNVTITFYAQGSGLVVSSKTPKLEEGDTATPWTPAPSDDYQAAYPTYRGEYTDFTQADSENPSDYTWVRVLGQSGEDGIPGKPGADGKTSYTHVAYANSSDSERNMNNWVLSEPAKQAATITYKNGVNTIDYKGVTAYEVFNFPVKAKKGQSFTFSFSWTQPDVKSLDGSANGASVSIADAPLTGSQIGRNVIYLGVSKTNSKLFTISGTATADETYVSINLGLLLDGIQWQFKASFQQDFSQDPGNHEYMGWYSDFTEIDSNDPSQYGWSLIKGADGAQGTPGKAGADGRTPYFHQAWADSPDGKTNFSTTESLGKKYLGTYTDYVVADSTDPTKYKWTELVGAIEIGGTNLLTGTAGPFTMGFGIPNTTWNTNTLVSEIALPTTVSQYEVLPNGSFNYPCTPGVTYTQSVYISTDAPLTGTPISFTWFTGGYGHNTNGKDNLVNISSNIYRATSTYTWPSNQSKSTVRFIDLMNLTKVFNFTKGTFLNFYKPKAEQGNTVTDWSPAPEDNASASDLAKTNQTVDTVVTQTAKNWSVFAQNNGLITGISVDANGVIDMSAKKVTIPGALIVGGSIPADALKNGSITNTQLADNSVGSSKIANGAITSGKIANGAIANINLANNSVSTAKIAGGAITASQIGKDAITSVQIKDGAVTAGAIAAGAVGANAIAANAVSANNIAAGAITADKIRANAINGKTITGSTFINNFDNKTSANTSIKGDTTISLGKISHNYTLTIAPDGKVTSTSKGHIDIGGGVIDTYEATGSDNTASGTFAGGHLSLTSNYKGIITSGDMDSSQLAMINLCGMTLWTGAWFVNGSQTITPFAPIDRCLNGWMLEWQLYVNGKANNTDIMETPIFKSVVQAHSGRGFSVDIGNYNNLPVRKYIYPTLKTIKGTNANGTEAQSKQFVLTALYAF